MNILSITRMLAELNIFLSLRFEKSADGAFLLLMFFFHNNNSNSKDNWRRQEEKINVCIIKR